MSYEKKKFTKDVKKTAIKNVDDDDHHQFFFHR